MAKLLGFQKRAGTDGMSSDQMVRILEKTYLNRTANGAFSNDAELQGFIDALTKMPQTPDVMEKIADLENKKLQFSAKQNDILTSKALFEDNLNDALRVEARNNYKDIGSLIGSYMNVYADAEEKIDQYINDSVYKRYGDTATPPQELIDLKNKIKEKARYYSTLTALTSTPEGIQSLNTEQLAVKINTNPLTGNIISVDVVPRNEVGDGYMQTDVKAKLAGGLPTAFPIFLNSQNDKTTALGTQTKFGRLGSMEFRGVNKLEGGEAESKERQKEIGDGYGVGQLKAQNENVGTFDWLNVFSDSPEEKANKGLDSARTEGMTFNDFNFDGNDIPSQSLVRKGNRLYFQQENGDVSEFEGADYREKVENAKKYLTEIGVDPTKVNAPLYADDVYFVAPDGTSKVKERIGADYFAPPVPSQPTSKVFSTPAVTPEAQAAATPAPGLTSTFFNNTNRLDKPNTRTQTTTPSIIEKGKGFFRKALGA